MEFNKYHNWMVTVFTPVHNRAYILGQLYRSLCRQTCKDFEWLVVDDGSSDGIDELMEDFISEGRLKIRYFKKNNGGKHTAINFALSKAQGEYFFIVDSDDIATPDAVQWIISRMGEVDEDSSYVGISGIRINPDGQKIGGAQDFDSIDADALEIRYKYNVKGDLAEVFKTHILKNFSFPEIEGEKFCPEGLIWNRMARAGYKLRLFNHGIYQCRYLDDGLTRNNSQLRRNSPEASMMFYSELLKYNGLPWLVRVKCALFYWRFSEKSKRNFRSKLKDVGVKYLPFFIPGLLMRKMTKKTNISRMNHT